MGAVTSTVGAGVRAWRVDDLPRPFHTMVSQFGERLVARLVGPGDAYGVNGVRPERKAHLVELRQQDQLDEVYGNPGRVVITIEAKDLAASALAGWELVDTAMPYAVDTEQWHRFLAAFDSTFAPHNL